MKQAKQGPGAFQWNLGGWLGGQIGGTLWLLLLGIMTAVRDLVPGLLVIGCAAVPNVFGAVLWRLRHRIEPYPALQCLIATIGLFALLAVLVIHLFVEEAGVKEGLSPWFLLIFPGLMVLFHLVNRANAPRSSG